MNGEMRFADPVLLAGAAACCGGAFALLDPFFRGVTEAAAALAVVAWVPRISEPAARARTAPPMARVLGGLLSMLASGAAFLLLPPPIDRFGGLLLGSCAAALVLWVPANDLESTG
jgi:hypothetical protein